MKAIQIKQLGRPEVLQLVETETPVPGPGQVLVKVATAGVNFAETMMRQGLYPIQLSLPTILGSEASGTVVAHGANVQTHAIGTRVAVPFTASGSYAEFVVADAASVFPLPERLDFPQATALLVQGLTAYFLLRLSAPPQPGQSILIQAAAGGVGSLAVQLAKLWGAGTVIATASTTEKLELARRLGADVAINYTEPDWVTQVRQATNGKGVDIVLESVGGQIGEQSLQALAPHGRLVVYGALDVQLTSLNKQQVNQLVYQNQAFIGFALPTLLEQHPELTGEALQNLFDYTINGQLSAIVGKQLPLADASEAHRALEQRQTTGKVVLLP